MSERQIWIHLASGNRYIIRQKTEHRICLQSIVTGTTRWVSRLEFEQQFNVGRETWEA